MMKQLIFVSIFLLFGTGLLLVNDFKSDQLKFPRVKQAYSEKEKCIKDMLLELSIKKVHIYIRAFKQEEKLEVWGKDKDDQRFKLITSFPFCYSSGYLGPKRRQGDYQIPEGFYEIDRFNPESNFHLSLGIDYPNESDKIQSNASKLGGDIFIHGSCFTVGCIPITDDWIEEVYILAVEAKHNGQLAIPVHIFPSKLNDDNYEELIKVHANYKEFWLNLKEGYHYFESTRLIPTITVNEDGKYLIN
ncbi:hypothetical protein [Winogradskyella sp. 3972H.M.0a.05]|uniref:L,D-transpeptidase family protein n=1 Tax=Winogradskyella sp. 3972H.M.0a.05 TaxID=2950277 RepID=UPI00339524B8